MINVWDSWCSPCRAEAPALAEVYAQVKDQGVQALGINTRDQEAQTLAFVKRFGLALPSRMNDGLLQAQTVSTVSYQKLLSLIELVLADDGSSASPSLT